MIRDICRNYWLKTHSNNEDVNISKYFVCNFINRNINTIPLNKILNSKKMKSLYPSDMKPKIKTSYKYQDPIRRKVLNYSRTVKDYHGEELSCTCVNNKYKDPQLGHVVTGDISIVKNRKLRNLLNKGLNYREPENLSKNYILKSKFLKVF